jgi:hypothetical protein
VTDAKKRPGCEFAGTVDGRDDWVFQDDWTEGERERGWRIELPTIGGAEHDWEEIEHLEVGLHTTVQMAMVLRLTHIMEELAARERREKMN